MDDNIKRFLAGIKVGAKQADGNITVYCLPAALKSKVKYLTLDEPLDKWLRSVTHLGESGNAPELRVVNRSDQNVPMLDGEELARAPERPRKTRRSSALHQKTLYLFLPGQGTIALA